MNDQRFCMNCMQDNGGLEVCMHCGFLEGTPQARPDLLPHRLILHDRYFIGHALSLEGKKITYAAYDPQAEQRVLIWEYFPQSLVTRTVGSALVQPHTRECEKPFATGKKNFSKRMASFRFLFEIPGAVRLLDSFNENNTAYAVIERLDDVTLEKYVLKEAGGKLSEDEALLVLCAIAEAVAHLHKAGYLHLRVSPAEIFAVNRNSYRLNCFNITAQNARTVFRFTDSLCAYSAPELYSKRKRCGKRVDVYGLAATLYFMLTGRAPAAAPARMRNDCLRSPIEFNPHISPQVNKALMRALSLDPRKRFRSPKKLLFALGGYGMPGAFAERHYKRIAAIRLFFFAFSIALAIIGAGMILISLSL